MMAPWLLALLGSFVLAASQLASPAVDRMAERARTRLSSFAGGVGLAYVTLYLLLKLAKERAPALHALLPLGPGPLETLFLWLLAALAAAYLVYVRLSNTPDPLDDYRHYGSFLIVYSLLVGGGLIDEARDGLLNLGLYVVALGLHLHFSERFLCHVSPQSHTWGWRVGLAAAPVVGCVLDSFGAVPRAVPALVLTLVAGVTIINVIRQELPDPRNFHPLSFLVGVVVYAALLTAIWRF